jgi:Asp-tRNA(Asn)/Glu-tRNA(Gln) amidotransferase A subunit family amidase
MAQVEVSERSRSGAGASAKTELRGYVSLAGELRSGKTSPRDFLEGCLHRIAQLEPGIGAFVQINAEEARAAADLSTVRWRAGKPLSPIDGMPLAIKDIIETTDMPTGQGSPLWEGQESRRDSASVHALREAGAVILGKTTTTEFASSHPFHTTRNPHDATRTPGGSSSGSAAAVGAGMVPAGLGTQVVGSILRPASFCGCIGFKPSVGAINRSGSHDHFSQSCQGGLGASLADVWGVVIAIAERAGGDPGFVGLTGPVDFARRARPARLAALETGGWSSTTEGARKAFAAARDTLAAAGVEIRSRADDPTIEAVEREIADALPVTMAINAWEGRWPLNTYADLDASKLSGPARERLKIAEAMTQREYGELLARRATVRAAYDNAAQKYDAFITAGACGAAPVGLGTTGNTAMNVTASLLGVPALTLPLLSDEGLPLGLQLLGGRDRDAALFDVAGWVLGGAFGRADLVGTLG